MKTIGNIEHNRNDGLVTGRNRGKLMAVVMAASGRVGVAGFSGFDKNGLDENCPRAAGVNSSATTAIQPM
jgi:hypothetical protein